MTSKPGNRYHSMHPKHNHKSELPPLVKTKEYQNGKRRQPSIRLQGKEKGQHPKDKLSWSDDHDLFKSVKQRDRLPPASMDEVHRKVLVIVTQVTDRLKAFRAAWKPESWDWEQCQACARELLTAAGISELLVDSPEKFEQLVFKKRQNGFLSASRTKRHSESISSDTSHSNDNRRASIASIARLYGAKTDVDQLEKICQRDAWFLKLSKWVRQQLTESRTSYLELYLLSFSEECGDSEDRIECIDAYEEKVTRLTDEVQEKVEKLEDLEMEYKDSKSTFVGNYLQNADQVDQLISEFCNVAQQVCTAMRTWCREDRLYPKRLWEEIIRTTNRRGKLLEQQKRAERKHRDITQQLDRKRVCQCELDKEVSTAKVNLTHIQTNLETATRMEEDQTKKVEQGEKEVERQQHVIDHRQSNSLAAWLHMCEISDELKIALTKVRRSLEAAERHKERLQKSEQEGIEAKEKAEKKAALHKEQVTSLEDRLSASEDVLSKMQEELSSSKRRASKAKEIRETKLSTITIRKIHYRRTMPGQKDVLTRACSHTAGHVGRDWRTLYMLLPFYPVRAASRRRRDVDIIDIVGFHGDKDESQLAQNALDKWRVYHHRGAVVQLVRSLTKIKQPFLADQVQLLFGKSNATVTSR